MLLTRDNEGKTEVRNDAARRRRDAPRAYRSAPVQQALRVCQIRLADDRRRACGTGTWHGGETGSRKMVRNIEAKLSGSSRLAVCRREASVVSRLRVRRCFPCDSSSSGMLSYNN